MVSFGADDGEYSIGECRRMLRERHGLVRVEADYVANLETMPADIFGLKCSCKFLCKVCKWF